MSYSFEGFKLPLFVGINTEVTAELYRISKRVPIHSYHYQKLSSANGIAWEFGHAKYCEISHSKRSIFMMQIALSWMGSMPMTTWEQFAYIIIKCTIRSHLFVCLRVKAIPWISDIWSCSKCCWTWVKKKKKKDVYFLGSQKGLLQKLLDMGKTGCLLF